MPHTQEKVKKSNYEPYHAFYTEGGRIGVMSCKICGAAVIIDDKFASEIHDK